MPQIATDGLALYEAAILRHFGYAVPYVQTAKRFANGGGRPGFSEKFSHAKGVEFIEKRVVFGAPDLTKTTTYALKRSHLTSRQWNAQLHRRTLAFSKRLASHKASIATQHVYRNLCHIPREMRVTPGMAAGITDKVWSLADLMAAVLSEVPGERPTPKPLDIPRPEGTARELPGGLGWLRMLPGGSGAPSPAPAPATPPAAPAAPAPVEPAAEPTGQLDLLSWRTKPRPVMPIGTQLELFGNPRDEC